MNQNCLKTRLFRLDGIPVITALVLEVFGEALQALSSEAQRVEIFAESKPGIVLPDVNMLLAVKLYKVSRKP